ncbi:MAG: class I SAM-dependent methyltransferase [Chitinophagaceae bacterium]|nr:class I SAM-dependent methyltransferase [Chitinophagaceae bacterium]
MASFADHFSQQSEIYVRARPQYPEELFQYLSSLCPHHDLAWDCATGNGQCAVSLANYFNQIIATDASAEQLSNARPKENIRYALATAEDASMIEDHSLDLLTVATAAHWFNLSAFFKEAHRTLKKKAVLAIWSYAGNTVEPYIDEIVNPFAYEFLLPYWPHGARKNWMDQYHFLTIPYPELKPPSFEIRLAWNLNQYLEYMMSWSAVNAYMTQHQQNPLDLIVGELTQRWGDPNQPKICTWKLMMKVGIKP